MKVRDKKVQKMTKDGLVEENLTDKSSVRVSNRASDVQMGGKQGEKEVSLVDKSSRQSERSGKNIRPSVQKSRDAPELIRAEKQSEDLGQSRKQQNRKRIRAEVGKESRLAEKSEAGQSGRLKEKRADLSENRGDSRRNQTGGSKKPKQKQRLKFAYEETGASVKNDKDMEKLNQMDTDGVNFRHQKQKEKAKKFSYEEAKKKKEAKQHSKKAQVYQANDGEAPGKKKSRLKFGEGESVKTEKTSVVKKAGSATSAALHREISKNEDDNAAVEGAHKLEESGEGVYRLEQRSARRRKQRAFRKRSRLERQEEKQTQAAARQEQKKLKKQIQKQQIKRDYAKAKRSEQTVGTATKGTIDYIKKIGGKVTNFFKENRKVYISVAVLIGLMFLIITNVTSCSAVFLQNVITYTGTSYLSSDQAIREAELYYTQLEANLQERINNMESEEPGHEEYRYNIGPIEHILQRWLNALSENGYIECNAGKIKWKKKNTSICEKDNWKIVSDKWVGKLSGEHVINYYLKHIEKMEALLSGEMNAALLLFPEGTIELANCFYRENLMEKYLAYCIEKILSFAIEHTKKDKIRILELGAGTGATTDRILKVLENSTKKIAYIYSDITKYFLNFAAQKYQGKEELEYKVINIDSNLSDQGIAEESVDIVIAAGMMNNAVNTDYSMRQIICSLVHGGIALIAEPVGENYELMLSQSFMMSRPTDAREVCNETFLKMEEWKEVFWGCGISERELVVVPSDTSPLAPLNQKLFIIRKE